MKLKLANHNQEAYEKVVERFKTNNKTAVIHATGTGKTSIALKWLEESKDDKVLYLTPNKIIIDQVKEYIEKQGVEVPQIEFMTYYELANKEELTGYDKIVLDEFHRCGAPTWEKNVNKLLTDNQGSKVLGLTATPKRHIDGKNMLTEIFHNDVASELPLTEAMKKGIIKIPTYVNAMYSFKESFHIIQSKIDKMQDAKEKEKIQREFNQAKRKIENASGLKELIKKYLVKEDGKYIVFCNDIKDMHKKMKEFKHIFEDINEVEISEISKNKSHKNNKETIKKFENSKNNKTKLLFTVDKLNEGIHINGVDGIFMLRPTQSTIIYMQQLGRALSMSNNEASIIFDLTNNLYSSKYIYRLREELRREKINNNKEKQNYEDDFEVGEFKIEDDLFEYVELLEKINKKLERSYISKTLDILELLRDDGVNVRKIQLRKAKNNKYRYTLLKEIKHKDIEKIIEENELNPNMKIGQMIIELKDAYRDDLNNNGNHYRTSENERKRIENLGILERISQASETLDLLEVLKQNGVDLNKIQLYVSENKKQRSTLLKEIKAKNIDRIIKENKLDPNLEIGYRIDSLKQMYRGSKDYKLTDKEKSRVEALGIIEKEQKTAIERYLETFRILRQNKIDVGNLKTSVRENGKQRFISLKEIPYENIKKIIEENNLDPNEKIGFEIYSIRQACGGRGTLVINDEQKVEAREMGIVRNKLSQKEQEQQELDRKRTEAKELRDDVIKKFGERKEH